MAEVALDGVSLRVCLSSPTYQLVDVGDSLCFNGWSADKLTCTGGHAPGAILFSHSWICAANQIVDFAKAKQRAELIICSPSVNPGTVFALYGDSGLCYSCSDSLVESTGKWLVEALPCLAGRLVVVAKDVAVDTASHSDALPLIQLPVCDIHVTVEWLKSRLLLEPPSEDFCILHAGWDDLDEYADSHVPGSHYVNMRHWEDPLTMDRLPPADYCVNWKGAGCDSSRLRSATIVLYDGDVGICAARLGVILSSLGFANLHVLSGGLRAWKDAAFQTDRMVTSQLTTRPLLENTIPIGVSNPEVFVDIHYVQRIVAGECPDAVLVSCCSWKEYVGASSGYTYIKPKGRIPGARWVLSGTGKDDVWHWHDANGLGSDWSHIAKLYEVAGITKAKHVVLYCGTGWRCSSIWFYLRALGYEDVSVYDGGWFEWSADPANEISTGVPVDSWFSALRNYIPLDFLE